MVNDSSSRSGFMPARVLHLHPSRFCNLACQHCYSESGPHLRQQLSPEQIIPVLARLRTEGYDVLSLSGGEPLLYSGFEIVVRTAVELGYRVNLISNGAALSGKKSSFIADYVNLIAISLDGAPETHTQMRRDANAFKQAERALNRLQSVGANFGIAYCVSQKSLSEMPWAVDFAVEKSAALLQFHPLAATGRGQSGMEALCLDAESMRRAYVVASLLALESGPAIQLDLAPIEAVRLRRHDYPALHMVDASHSLLSDLVNPLIIDDAGQLLPLCYGVHTAYAIGKINGKLEEQIAAYKESGWHSLAQLLEQSFTALDSQRGNFVDWFFHILQCSHTVLPSQPCTIG